jgi:hypothetical protein
MRIVGDRRGRSTGGGRARALESLAMAMGESVFLLTVGGRSLPWRSGHRSLQQLVLSRHWRCRIRLHLMLEPLKLD